MTGQEYELLVEAILQRHGLQTTRTPISGDQGVDLIAVHGEVRLAIQCKRSQGAIGNGAVQEVVAGARHHQCSVAVVVSDATFTPGARQLAKTNEVFLTHHDELDGALQSALGSEPGRQSGGMNV
jgi:restriction system protein